MSIIELDAARRLGFSTTAPGVTDGGVAVGIGSEKPKLWNMTFDSFEIGDEQVQHPRIAVVESAPNYRGRKEFDMRLGRDFLSAHHVLLAPSQKLFYYSHNGRKVFL